MRITSVAELQRLAGEWKKERAGAGAEIRVCAGTGCIANGSNDTAAALREAVAKAGASAKVTLAVKRTGCHGFCEKGPLVVLHPSEIFYTRVQPEDAVEIVEKTVLGGETVLRLLYKDPATRKTVERYPDIPFYARQKRVVLKNIGRIDPEDLREYVAEGGYLSLAKVLSSMTPEQVIREVEASGIRGRGGAGFPTGRKWRSCVEAPGDVRYIICNGDEGDPGAFMDRSMMEGDPHAVLEGMGIGAFAVGARTGYIYVREEYPLAITRLQKAIEEAREAGLLGENILGTRFSFDVRLSRGGGAFVCGESSALMRSVAGEVGEPRAKYIRSVVKGLFDKPTVLNNVETFANLPQIFEHGAAWFASMGTARSKGTKAFALVGKVKNTGLVEAPMGASLRSIIFDIGGGILKDRQFKAVQTGGPSGGCLPESRIDLPVDFDSLTEAGSMMGSGGMIVMDERTCMVDVARYFTKFLVEESCGKCVPCREGTIQMSCILQDICAGRGRPEHLAMIERLAAYMSSSALCALGTSAPNPVAGALRHFRSEFEAHIRDKKCPAGVCKALTTFAIDAAVCNGCGACAKACTVEAVSGKKKETHVIDPKKCTRCGQCREVCPRDAVKVV